VCESSAAVTGSGVGQSWRPVTVEPRQVKGGRRAGRQEVQAAAQAAVPPDPSSCEVVSEEVRAREEGPGRSRQE